MEEFGTYFTQFATREVFTVLAALVTAWLGWKSAKKVGGGIKTLVSNASFRGLTSMALLFAGFSGVGLGIGEWASRDGEPAPAKYGISNNELRCMLNDSDDYLALTEVLQYAMKRDEKKQENESGGVDYLIGVKGAEATHIPINYKPYAIQEVPIAAIHNQESLMSTPMAWLSFALGWAALIASFCVYAGENTSDKQQGTHY
jgi:hypothetical protein